MDACLVCERPYQLLPRASELRNELRPITRDSSPKREKCCHFSIRGYVAEVLKSDTKICWPFHDYINLEKQENLLPSISVTEFRWWDCQNCLNKTSARENGEMTERYACINVNAKETFIDEISIMASQPTTSNFLYGEDEISERTLNGQSVERNCFPVTNSIIRSYPFVPSSNGEKDSSNDHEAKEATHTCTSGNDVIGEDQIQNMNMSSDDAVKHNQQNSERHNTLEANRFTSCSNPSMVFSKLPFRRHTQITTAATNDENSPQESKVLLESSREICKETYTEKGTRLPQSMTNSVDQIEIITKNGRFVTNPMNRKFRHLPERVNNYFQKDVAQKLDKPHLLGTKLKQLDEGKCYASVKDGMNGRRNEGHHVNQQLYPSKNSSKKTRKTRTLNDILKSEVLGIDKKIPASDGKLKDHAYLKCDVFKEGDACKVQKHSNAFQKEKIKVLKRKRREQMPESEDEEFPLMHWVTKTPSKAKIVKLHTENKEIGRLDIVPKPSESIPFEKLTSFTMKPCRSSHRDGRVSGISKHHNRVSEDENLQQGFEPPRKNSGGRNQFARKDGLTKLNSRTAFTNSSRDMVGKRATTLELVDGRPHKKGSMRKEHSIIPLGKKENPMWSMVQRNSLAHPSYKSISKEPNPEQSNNMSYPTAVDGIPVEILKLLQENWRKRHLQEHSKQSMVELSKVGKNQETGSPSNSTNCHRDGVVSTTVENWPIRNAHSISSTVGHETSYPTLKDQAGQSFKSGKLASADGLRAKAVENFCQEWNFDDINSNAKCKSNISLAHHGQFGDRNGLRADGLCAKAVENSCQEWNFDDINSNAKCKSNISLAHHGQFGTFNGFMESSSTREQRRSVVTLPLINSMGTCPPNQKTLIQQADSYIDGTVLGHDPRQGYTCSQSSLVYSSLTHGKTKSPENVVPGHNLLSKPSQNALLSTNSIVMHLQKGEAPNSKISKFLGEVDGYRSRSEPSLNLYKKNSFSAMHLLELMDPAISSIVPSCSSTDRRQQESNTISDLSLISKHGRPVSVQACTRKNQAFMHHVIHENFSRSHHPGVSYNLCFQAPGSDVPGPSFATNSTYSVNDSPSLSYYCGKPQPFPQEGSMKEKQKISLSTSRSKARSQSFLSSDDNLEGSFLSLAKYASQHKTLRRKEEMQLQKKKKNVEVDRSLNKNRGLELCVLNRNPADFTAPDECNEYMIRYDSPTSRKPSLHHNKLLLLDSNHRKRQKAMKLTALKELLRN